MYMNQSMESLPLSGSDAGPNGIDESGLRLGLLFVSAGLPRPNTQKAEQIGLIYLGHAPPAFQQGVIGAVDEIRQRQDACVVGCAFVSGAAFVGNSSRISVVCVCTAMSASAISCIRRSTG